MVKMTEEGFEDLEGYVSGGEVKSFETDASGETSEFLLCFRMSVVVDGEGDFLDIGDGAGEGDDACEGGGCKKRETNEVGRRGVREERRGRQLRVSIRTTQLLSSFDDIWTTHWASLKIW